TDVTIRIRNKQNRQIAFERRLQCCQSLVVLWPCDSPLGAVVAFNFISISNRVIKGLPDVSNRTHQRSRVAASKTSARAELNGQRDRRAEHKLRGLITCKVDQRALPRKDSLTRAAQSGCYTN